MKRLLLLLLCAMSLTAAAEQSKYDLPLDMAYVAPKPDAGCFSKDGYSDDSLTVKTETCQEGDIRYHVIRFDVKSPSQLRTAVAGRPNQSTTTLPSRMGRAKNAVALINGEFYVQRTRDILVYRQGVMYRNEVDPMKDVLIIDKLGNFHVFTSEGKVKEIDDFLKNGGEIVNAFSFGPALVKDGEVCEIRDDYYFKGYERLPRTAVAQMGDLSYAFVMVEGLVHHSKGCTHQQMADLLGRLGAKQAYGMDGGQSCVIMFHGRHMDGRSPNLEREQSDILYVVSAVGDSR